MVTAVDFMTILKRIAGQGLSEGEVYDEQFIGNEINNAYGEYDALLKDRDRIKERYIEDFTKPKEEVKEDKEEEKEGPVELTEFLNI